MSSSRSLALDRRWVLFGLAALGILMSSIDGTIVAVALPTFIRDLDASLTWAGWTYFSESLAIREQTFRIMAAEMSDTHRDWFPLSGLGPRSGS